MREQILAEIEKVLKDTDTFFNAGGEVNCYSDDDIHLYTRRTEDGKRHKLSICLRSFRNFDEKSLTIDILDVSSFTFKLNEDEFIKFKYLCNNIIEWAKYKTLSVLKSL